MTVQFDHDIPTGEIQMNPKTERPYNISDQYVRFNVELQLKRLEAQIESMGAIIEAERQHGNTFTVDRLTALQFTMVDTLHTVLLVVKR